jgi:flagellar motility protein MotE (MotC chaperone)
VKNIRLLPVVVLAIAALLVLKTLGLVTNGGYVLTGVRVVQASGASAGGEGGATTEADATLTLPEEPTLEDTSPTLDDQAPTIGQAAETGGGHGAPAAEAPAADHGATAAEGEHAPAAEAEHAAEPAAATDASSTFCAESDAAIQADGTVIINPASAAAADTSGGHGAPAEAASEGDGEAATADHGEPAATEQPLPSFAASMADCLPSGDAVPMQIDGHGGTKPLVATDGASLTEQQLLERLAARRTELEQYEQDLALRASIVDAAEQRIAERSATLEALEAQISALVDQRTEMESGQFAGIVAMYETMKPKDAATIFNNLDMNVLLRVAKAMSARKMAPILAEMDTARAQELTVKMADLADQPATEMTPEDLAALPQIVGQ